MEPDDILLLENHNERFENYDQFDRVEKLLLIKETAVALGSFIGMKDQCRTMEEIKNYVRRLPDVKLIQVDIDERIRVLQENDAQM